jgi:hypothetical protein
VDPVAKLVIEAGCVTGTALVAAATTPLLSGKRRTPSMLVPWGGGLVLLIGYAFINPRGDPDPFPVVVGGCIFVSVLVGLIAALTLGWRWFHRDGDPRLRAKTARDFGTMVFFGMLAAACLVGLAAFGIAVVQSLATEISYRTSPDCATSVSSSCRSQVPATVVQTRAESPRGRHWIDVGIGGKTQTIEIETATDVWAKLVPGQEVELTRWRGAITQVSRPGVGTMQTSDSPGMTLLIASVFAGACLFGLMVSSLFGLLYWSIWRAETHGTYVADVA